MLGWFFKRRKNGLNLNISHKSYEKYIFIIIKVFFRFAVSRTFSPNSVEVVRGRGHALPPPQFRGQGQDISKVRGQGQLLQTSQIKGQDSFPTQRSALV